MIFENQLIPYTLSEVPEGPYLVFAPHPDDETLGMGGIISLASNSGIEVNIVFITNGDKGGDPEIRKHEADAALKILGVRKKFYLNLLDREVGNSQFPAETLNDIMEEVQASTWFLPSFQEIHPDHRAATHKVLSFLTHKKHVFDLWFYEINRQGEVNRLIDITSVVDRKKQAVDCYKSQLDQLDYKSHALCLDFARSLTSGGDTLYAEGFWHYDPESGMTPEDEYFTKIHQYRSDYCALQASSDEIYASKLQKLLILFKKITTVFLQ